jgi:hypothetical protein
MHKYNIEKHLRKTNFVDINYIELDQEEFQERVSLAMIFRDS